MFSNSGKLGAIAACVGKLGLDYESPLSVFAGRACDERNGDEAGLLVRIVSKLAPSALVVDDACAVATLIPQGVCLVLMILANAVMINAFLNRMGESGSVSASALSTAANLLVIVVNNNKTTV